jgi:hypothetical protein
MAPYLKINSYLRFSDEFGSVPRGCVKSIPVFRRLRRRKKILNEHYFH